MRRTRLLSTNTLRGRVESALAGTPLEPIGCKLLQLMATSAAADNDGANDQGQAVLYHVRGLLDLLPDATRPRFTFDTLMIQAVATAWRAAPHPLSGAIVPCYGDEWHLTRKQLIPAQEVGQIHVLELLTIRGENNEQHVDLSEYGWMVHELAHSLLYRNAEIVIPLATGRLDPLLRDLRVAGVADRGHTKSIKQRSTDQVIDFWTPTQNQINWVHELIVDIIGIGTAGVAYGRNYLEETSGQHLRPFELTQSHPPLAIRACALLQAAEQLGWTELAPLLHARLKSWATDPAYEEPENLYRAATAEELVSAAVEAGFDVISALKLPLCTPAQSDAAKVRIAGDSLPALGIETLLAAWHAADLLTEDGAHQWTQGVIQAACE